jgi:hypothetical protein
MKRDKERGTDMSTVIVVNTVDIDMETTGIDVTESYAKNVLRPVANSAGTALAVTYAIRLLRTSIVDDTYEAENSAFVEMLTKLPLNSALLIEYPEL